MACLLLEPPPEPLHAVALALKARGKAAAGGGPELDPQERSMRLGEAAAVRALWRRQRELEGVLEDRLQIEPVKAEALRELEEITERLRQSPWLSHQGAERCVKAVADAIMALFRHLVLAVDAEGKPEPVLHALARHLYQHVLLPSGRCRGPRVAPYLLGCFTYEPPAGVVWDGGQKCQVPSVTCQVQGPEGEECGASSEECDSAFKVQGSKFGVQGSGPRFKVCLATSASLSASRWRWRC